MELKNTQSALGSAKGGVGGVSVDVPFFFPETPLNGLSTWNIPTSTSMNSALTKQALKTLKSWNCRSARLFRASRRVRLPSDSFCC
jgi:hypothetical protein